MEIKMNFFSNKENDELFSLIDKDDEELYIPPQPPERRHGFGALTPEEIVSFSDAGGNHTDTSALESLKKRMINARAETKEADNEVRKPAEAEAAPESEKTEDKSAGFNLSDFSDLFEKDEHEKSTEPAAADHTKASDTSRREHKKTLLEKCRPFILDDEGKDSAMKTTPAYKLESVAEILQNESQKAIDKLSEKYNISFDDLGKSNPAAKPKAETADSRSPSEEYGESAEREVFEDIFSSEAKMPKAEPAASHIISDIDNTAQKPLRNSGKDISGTATIRFTPVSDSDSTSRISVSSQTRPLDLTDEFTQLSDEESEPDDSEVKLEQTEFEEYIPKEEFEKEKDARHFLRKLSLKKRSCFLKAVFSVFLTLILGASRLPFMSETILAHTRTAGIIGAAILGIIILINADMFLSAAKIISRRSSPDICAATASLSVMIYAAAAAFNNTSAMDMLILCGCILSVRALCRFFSSSGLLLGFRQISGSASKRAVKLISDQAVTYAMAKNSIEGDVLAAAPCRTAHIDGYMKYSTFRIILAGKLPVITLLSVLLSVTVGFACASYFDGVIYGFYSAAAIQCFAAAPSIFFIDSLPLYSAAKRLGRSGAMIAGKVGAEQIENANAVVFSSEDIFPSGTVILHQLRMLSDNSIDDTIIRAASLTDALDSPLAPIFKKIAGTDKNIVLPNSDTVKYEDRMGISGWVDNKLLFIGNRTLMEAHGIEVPGIETDRKILRQGFFPVYVASEDKACALLSVQYIVRPEIARELRKVSALGVTMLINSSDPNMTEEMICDYMGLYDDSVKVMSAAGCHMYKNAVTFTPRCQAPAAYKGNPIGLAAIISCASGVKKSNILLTVLYTLTSVLGAILFTYISFSGSGSPVSDAAVLIYLIACTALSYILYLTQKP